MVLFHQSILVDNLYISKFLFPIHYWGEAHERFKEFACSTLTLFHLSRAILLVNVRWVRSYHSTEERPCLLKYKRRLFLEQRLLNNNNFTIFSISLLKSNSGVPRVPCVPCVPRVPFSVPPLYSHFQIQAFERVPKHLHLRLAVLKYHELIINANLYNTKPVSWFCLGNDGPLQQHLVLQGFMQEQTSHQPSIWD